MKILIVGMGVVGRTTAKGFSELGHTVICRDLGGDRPVSDVCFICTPEAEVGWGTSHFLPGEVGKAMIGVETGCLVIRSTTVPGTIDHLGGHICHNPCFIRAETAYKDFMHPQMTVIGECCKTHGDILEELYSGFGTPIFRVDVITSEMIKLTMNSYFATLISFWNEIKPICDKLGVSSDKVAEVCKGDNRVSRYGTLRHGHPFGWPCLPKDLRHMIELFETWGISVELLRAVESVNRSIESELYIASRA